MIVPESILYMSAIGHQDRPRPLLQATRRAGNEATDHLQRRTGPFGHILGYHLL